MTNSKTFAVTMSPDSAFADCADFVGTADDNPPRARRYRAKARGGHRAGQAHVHRSTNGDQQLPTASTLRDQLVLKHLPLVKVIAVHIHRSLPPHVDLEDMVQAGNLGLFDAASKYDYKQQVVFATYAKHRIRGAILDSFRQLDWASRDMRRRQKEVETATDQLAAELQRAPTEAEVAEKLGEDVEHLRTKMVTLRKHRPVSTSTHSNDREYHPGSDFPDKPEAQPDYICALAEVRGRLGKALKSLPERYQKVMLLYYNDEMTMKEIGCALGIQESRVSQIHKSALGKMATVLEANGITSASQCMLSTHTQ
ncbi:MAG: FliA/WhiG family RNA polymerase sigma factor [Bryobacteraceae bacterium]|jgi:RNA polymerase sigma factor for flagellar operon FliA